MNLSSLPAPRHGVVLAVLHLPGQWPTCRATQTQCDQEDSESSMVVTVGGDRASERPAVVASVQSQVPASIFKDKAVIEWG